MVDCSILRFETRDSPGSASTGETPLQKISKVVDPRDTKQLFGEISLPWKSPGISLDQQSGRGIRYDAEFTLSWSRQCASWKTRFSTDLREKPV